MGTHQLVGRRALAHVDPRGGVQPAQVVEHRVADGLQLEPRVAVLHVADHDPQLVRVQPVVAVLQRRQGQAATHE